MIPPFEESGYLPPGWHGATLAETEARFGRQSELRPVQMESVRWMVDLARRAGAERIVLNGSFVTDIIEPNDVDCVLLIGARPADRAAFREAEMESLKRFINQLKEEIARYEARPPARR